MSSWTPPTQQQQPLPARSCSSSSRSNASSQDLLGSYSGSWWPLTGIQSQSHHHHSDIRDISAVSTSCLNHDLFASDHSSDNSPPQPRPTHDFIHFDQFLGPVPHVAPPTSIEAASSASSDDWLLGLSPSFLEQQSQDSFDLYPILLNSVASNFRMLRLPRSIRLFPVLMDQTSPFWIFLGLSIPNVV